MQELWATKRRWLPFAGAVLCLLLTAFTSALVAAILLLVAVFLFFDGATLWWERNGAGLTDYKQ